MTAFPPRELLLEGNTDEQRFVQEELEPGLDYYLRRLDRIAFAGERVLDAGCGIGQWSAALAQRFARVAAIDVNPARLRVARRLLAGMGIDNADLTEASVEQLPFEEGSFDAVFCYGVIMLVATPQALAELGRVLAPGGRLYLCLNADGWSRYLIETRPDEPAVRSMARNTLYSTAWRRARNAGLLRRLREGLRVADQRLALVLAQGRLRGRVRRLVELGRGHRGLALAYLTSRPGGRELRSAVREVCGEGMLGRLYDDVWAVMNGAETPPGMGQTQAYNPGELQELAAAAGLVDFQWAEEAGLVCATDLPDVEPRYPGRHGELCVWECLMTRPGAQAIRADPERHLEQARRAGQVSVFLEPSPDPVLSLQSLDSFPHELLALAEREARHLGGDAYLDRLVRELLRDFSDEQEMLRGLLTFVQGALYRDPVAQPRTPDGGLPSPLITLLCARGRCGHATHLLIDLCHRAGLQARAVQLSHHIVAEVRCNERWRVADADAFKHGVIPTDADGELLTMESIRAQPTLLDCFAATGWLPPARPQAFSGRLGFPVRGYIEPHAVGARGFVSGYYDEAARGRPPAPPVITSVERTGGELRVSWQPGAAGSDSLVGYQVCVGTRSRGWRYEAPDSLGHAAEPLPTDVASETTADTSIRMDDPGMGIALYVSVVAISRRVELQARTFFWPSPEACA